MLKDRMEKVKANGINVRFITGMGTPAEGIVDVAENEHVDLIVMGSRELKREKEYSAGKLPRIEFANASDATSNKF